MRPFETFKKIRLEQKIQTVYTKHMYILYRAYPVRFIFTNSDCFSIWNTVLIVAMQSDKNMYYFIIQMF